MCYIRKTIRAEIKNDSFCVYKVVEDTGENYESLYFCSGSFKSGLQKAEEVLIKKQNIHIKPNGQIGWFAFLEYHDAVDYCCEETHTVVLCWVRKNWIIQIGEDYFGRIVGRFKYMIFPKYPEIIAIEPKVEDEIRRINSLI